MTEIDPEIADLWLRHLSGSLLSAEDDRRLSTAIEADATLLRELLDDDRIDALLGTMGRARHEAEPFDTRLLRRLALERDAARFTSALVERVRDLPPPKRRHATGWTGTRGRTVALAVGMAAAFALVVGGFALRRSGEDPRQDPLFAQVVDLQGSAMLTEASGRRPLQSTAILRPGDEIATGAGTSLVLAYLGDSRFAVGPEAALALDPPGEAESVVRVNRGRLEAEVAPQRPGHALVFATPHARATIVGTRLALDVSAAQTKIEVTSGRVLFERLADRSLTEIAAGQTAISAHASPTVREPAAPSAPSGPPPGDVFRFDFEDGLLPAGFGHGHVVPAPAGSDSRYCVIGTVKASFARTNVIVLVGPDGDLFTFSGSPVLAFDYWVGNDTPYVVVQFWNPSRRQNYRVLFKPPARRAWAHAEVRLADAKGILDDTRATEEGDHIGTLSLMAGRVGGEPFYVDNLILRR